MSREKRARALEQISTSRDTLCMLASIRAGGSGKCPSSSDELPPNFIHQGLDLTACNNVIIIEPWWNPALEVSLDVSDVVICSTSLLRTKRSTTSTASAKRVP